MITLLVRMFGFFLVLAAIAGVDHRDRRIKAIARNDRMIYVEFVECLGDLFPCMHPLVGLVVGGIGAGIFYSSWAVTIAQFLFKKFGV